MTKPLLAILLLLLAACDPRETLTELLDESPDGLDGKGLVCERLNLPWAHRDPWVDYSHDGFRFIDGRVDWDFIARGTVEAPQNAVSADGRPRRNHISEDYSESPTTIWWWDKKFVLNRSSLILKDTANENLEYRCRAFKTTDSHNEEIDRHLRKPQQKFAREMKDNKI